HRLAYGMAHGFDGRTVIGTGKNGRPGDQDIRSGLDNAGGILHLDTAINLKCSAAATMVDEKSGSRNFLENGRDKMLPPEAGDHGHHEQEVRVRDDLINRAEGGGRIAGHSRLDTQ